MGRSMTHEELIDRYTQDAELFGRFARLVETGRVQGSVRWLAELKRQEALCTAIVGQLQAQTTHA
jgi:hypothetical protein